MDRSLRRLLRPLLVLLLSAGAAGALRAQGDQEPEPIVQPQPVYPPVLRAQGVEGFAIVDFIVGVDGGVTQSFAIAFSNPAFAKSAEDNALRLRFKPGTHQGHAIVSRMQLPVVFSLSRSADATDQLCDSAARIYETAREAFQSRALKPLGRSGVETGEPMSLAQAARFRFFLDTDNRLAMQPLDPTGGADAEAEAEAASQTAAGVAPSLALARALRACGGVEFRLPTLSFIRASAGQPARVPAGQ